MMKRLQLLHIDRWIIGAVTVLLFFSIITMESLGSHNGYLLKQSIWAVVAMSVLFITSKIDMSFLKKSSVASALFIVSNVILVLVIFLGKTAKGATSWFNVGGISFQPSDLVKIVLILIMAKYLSRRHVEIADMKHLLITGIYCFIPFVLVFLQPDFGSAIIFGCIWFGMMMVSGLSKKHLLLLTGTGLVIGGLLWGFVFKPYQKARIMTFLNPLADVRGTGYNAYQSMIAVGSGQIIGKGVGFGTQSRLNFLPEYQTDFIFAAYAEEWGFVGVLLLFVTYMVLIWRILANSLLGATNFESLFGIGVAVLFISHFIVHVGMNIGLMPITGLTLPFMSYGGTNLLISFVALGIIMSMKRYARTAHRDLSRNEVVGVEY